MPLQSSTPSSSDAGRNMRPLANVRKSRHRIGGALMRTSRTLLPFCAALGLRVLGSDAALAQAPKNYAQVQPRARAQGALSRRLPELGQARSRSAPRAGSRSTSSTPRSSARKRTSSSRSARAPISARTPTSARMGNYVPGIAVMNGPYFAETLEDVAKLRKSPTVIKWQEELASKYGLKVLSFNWVQGYRHFFTNKPVKTPADLTGQRIRTPPAPIWQESIRALGAVPVAMAFGEMYPGLQQRAIDGVELVYNNIPGGRFYEVLKFANETKHIMLINFEVVSAKWFDSLPKEYPGRPGRGMRQGRRGDLEGDLQARGRGRAAAQGPRHDDRQGRRSRRLPQGRREGLRGAQDHRRQERRAQGDRQELSSARASDHEEALRTGVRGGGVGRRRVPRPDGRPDLPRRRHAHARPPDQLVDATPPPACSPGPASSAPTSPGATTA